MLVNDIVGQFSINTMICKFVTQYFHRQIYGAQFIAESAMDANVFGSVLSYHERFDFNL
jgi:hypothetical protein